jgi:DNA-binding transcriptional regulator YiaG
MDRGRSSHHGCPGEANGRALLAKRDVAEIREKYAAGVATQGVLAARFGVSQSTISAVINRDTWKDAS